MSSGKFSVKRLCYDALLLSVALLLSYLEFLLPLGDLAFLPGFRLGLANLAVMVAVFAVSPADGAVISLLRVGIMALLFGTVTTFWFSLCGAVLSLLVLVILYFLRPKMSFLGVSVLSAVAHNLGQLTGALILFSNKAVFSYLPALLLASLLFGSLCGFLMNVLYQRLPKVRGNEK